jgi:hypothetical protein
LCDVDVGEVETSGTGNEANDLPSKIWLIVGLFASASEIPSSQNASCVSPINKETALWIQKLAEVSMSLEQTNRENSEQSSIQTNKTIAYSKWAVILAVISIVVTVVGIIVGAIIAL